MAQKKAEVYYNDLLSGILMKEDGKYFFQYDEKYLSDENNPAISLTLPKQKEVFESDFLFPFFFGLLAEGENKEIQCRLLKIDENDHFTRLLKTAGIDTIGGITVREYENR
jgi:serine/threonine-protein kinase HipA